jgi:hypothetical protein
VVLDAVVVVIAAVGYRAGFAVNKTWEVPVPNTVKLVASKGVDQLKRRNGGEVEFRATPDGAA